VSANAERSLSPVLRVLLGVIGAIAVAAGIMVITYALRGFDIAPVGPALGRVLAVVVAALAVVGGVQLLRGALRGRIVHRRNAPPRGTR
jgi:hypothetical protein